MSEDRSGGNPARGDELGSRLAQDLVDVGRQESARLREDLVGQVRPAMTGVVLLAAAGAGALLAAAAASTAALRLLELVLPRRLAALALTGGYAAGSVVLLRFGLERLRAAGGGSQRLADEVSQGLAAARRSAEGAAQARLAGQRPDARTATDRRPG
jgi:hypothetical protein